MCFNWKIFMKDVPIKKFNGIFECSCDICGKSFDTMEKLIKHMGYHELHEINDRLNSNFGTVRCNKCWRSFTSVVSMSEHSCTNVIQELSPVSSSGSLDSILIHDTYIQEDNHKNY